MASPIDLTNSNHGSGSIMNIQHQDYPSPTTKCNPSFLLFRGRDDQQQSPSLTRTLDRVRSMKSVYIAKKANKKRCYTGITTTAKEVECHARTSTDGSLTKKILKRPASVVAEGSSQCQLGFGQEEPTRMPKRRRYQRRNSKTSAMLVHSMQLELVREMTESVKIDNQLASCPPSPFKHKKDVNSPKLADEAVTAAASPSFSPPQSLSSKTTFGGKWKKELHLAQDLVKQLLIHQQQRRQQKKRM